MPIFTANVPGVLKVGDKIEIGGKIKENARKMSVNLCAQEGEEPRDVVLHFDVRFHRDNIISLSRKNGVWIGSGNYDTNYNMFVPGTVFRIVFEIKDTDVITIYCQGKFHSNFLPKIPLSMARYIVAWADVERITHCYFHLVGMKPPDDEHKGGNSPPLQQRASPIGDTKRCAVAKSMHSPKVNSKKTPGSPHYRSSNDSSDEEPTGKLRPKGEGRADTFFYETLMCQPPQRNFGSPDRRRHLSRYHAEYARKYTQEASDTEKNESEDYTDEIASKNFESSQAESEEMPEYGLKKRRARGKLAQVVNFMGKSSKRN